MLQYPVAVLIVAAGFGLVSGNDPFPASQIVIGSRRFEQTKVTICIVTEGSKDPIVTGKYVSGRIAKGAGITHRRLGATAPTRSRTRFLIA